MSSLSEPGGLSCPPHTSPASLTKDFTFVTFAPSGQSMIMISVILRMSISFTTVNVPGVAAWVVAGDFTPSHPVEATSPTPWAQH